MPGRICGLTPERRPDAGTNDVRDRDFDAFNPMRTVFDRYRRPTAADRQ